MRYMPSLNLLLTRKRRAYRASQLSSSLVNSPLEICEERALLSGVAIYPQPAQVAVETPSTNQQVSVAGVPPADFSGTWKLATSEGLVNADIGQDGKKLEIVLNHDGTILPATGKVKGETFKARIKTEILGYKVRGKIISELTGPVTMAGNIVVTAQGAIPKIDTPFTGVRV